MSRCLGPINEAKPSSAGTQNPRSPEHRAGFQDRARAPCLRAIPALAKEAEDESIHAGSARRCALLSDAWQFVSQPASRRAPVSGLESSVELSTRTPFVDGFVSFNFAMSAPRSNNCTHRSCRSLLMSPPTDPKMGCIAANREKHLYIGNQVKPCTSEAKKKCNKRGSAQAQARVSSFSARFHIWKSASAESFHRCFSVTSPLSNFFFKLQGWTNSLRVRCLPRFRY